LRKIKEEERRKAHENTESQGTNPLPRCR
jgi:hypothetical protein